MTSQYLDDRLYPVNPIGVHGSYRGRRKRIFIPRSAGHCVQRTVESTANGWHRPVVKVDGHVYWRGPGMRDKAAAMELAIDLWVEEGN